MGCRSAREVSGNGIGFKVEMMVEKRENKDPGEGLQGAAQPPPGLADLSGGLEQQTQGQAGMKARCVCGSGRGVCAAAHEIDLWNSFAHRGWSPALAAPLIGGRLASARQSWVPCLLTRHIILLSHRILLLTHHINAGCPACSLTAYTRWPTARVEEAPRVMGLSWDSTSGGASSCSTATSLPESPAAAKDYSRVRPGENGREAFELQNMSVQPSLFESPAAVVRQRQAETPGQAGPYRQLPLSPPA